MTQPEEAERTDGDFYWLSDHGGSHQRHPCSQTRLRQFDGVGTCFCDRLWETVHDGGNKGCVKITKTWEDRISGRDEGLHFNTKATWGVRPRKYTSRFGEMISARIWTWTLQNISWETWQCLCTDTPHPNELSSNDSANGRNPPKERLAKNQSSHFQEESRKSLIPKVLLTEFSENEYYANEHLSCNHTKIIYPSMSGSPSPALEDQSTDQTSWTRDFPTQLLVEPGSSTFCSQTPS